MKLDYVKLAQAIREQVGGDDNISHISHCATRLRLAIHDMANVDIPAISGLPGVIRVVNASGQLQVVVGPQVEQLYQAMQREVLKNSPYVIGLQAKNLIALRDNLQGYVQGINPDMVYYSQVSK